MPRMLRFEVRIQFATKTEHLSAKRALMRSTAFVKRLNMIPQNASTRECQATFVATKGTHLGVHCSPVAIQIGLLVKRMSAYITDERLFLVIVAVNVGNRRASGAYVSKVIVRSSRRSTNACSIWWSLAKTYLPMDVRNMPFLVVLSSKLKIAILTSVLLLNWLFRLPSRATMWALGMC